MVFMASRLLGIPYTYIRHQVSYELSLAAAVNTVMGNTLDIIAKRVTRKPVSYPHRLVLHAPTFCILEKELCTYMYMYTTHHATCILLNKSTIIIYSRNPLFNNCVFINCYCQADYTLHVDPPSISKPACSSLPVHMLMECNTGLLCLSAQQGEYEIPEWLTPGSVGVISRLLQVSLARLS